MEQKNNPCPVLIVDDEPEIGEHIRRSLDREKTTSELVHNGADCLAKIRSGEFCVLVLDNQLPDTTGFEILEILHKEKYLPALLVIMITAYGTIESGLEAIRKGCFDYAVKPFNIEDLLFRIRRALEQARIRKSAVETARLPRFHELIGGSAEMRKIFDLIRLVGPNDIGVLVEGETGSGKELIARAIHEESRRNKNAFIPVNCGAIPDSLIESELFGYEKGAFTGASGSKFGLFETADKGTLFLDEINSLPLTTQVKLLRFIETGEYIKVGGSGMKKADVRIIAAANKDLESLVKDGGFREDLFFRLNIVRIQLPCLSARKDDIPLLLDHFVALYNRHFGKTVSFHPDIYPVFKEYVWKGNVRELKNAVQRIILMNSSGSVGSHDLPPDFHVLERAPVLRSFKEAKNEAVQKFETVYFTDLLRAHKGNVLKAAEAADMDRKHLTVRLKELGLDAGIFRKKG